MSDTVEKALKRRIPRNTNLNRSEMPSLSEFSFEQVIRHAIATNNSKSMREVVECQFKLSQPDPVEFAASRQDSPRPIGHANPTIAFSLDIDGVLMRSKILLPGATETLKMLQKYKIPFIFLTNSGGSE